jgi:hypothetical protein
LKRAGHPLPEPLDDPEWRELSRVFDEATPENRERIRQMASDLVKEQDKNVPSAVLAPAPAAA